jgi:uncharacterized integral membrane protein (TIGR00698 family)
MDQTRQLIWPIIPGVLLCAVVALASSHLVSLYGGPIFLFALLIGAAFHDLYDGGSVTEGVEFCSRTLLRWGVALLGARITLGQILGLGWTPVLVVLAAVATTIGVGMWLSGRLGLPRWKGLLSGGATAICGASAALAIAAALPKGPEKEHFTLVVVVAVTGLSTIAMVVYPAICQLLGLSALQSGLFLGGTIHDVAQVVAAGFMLSDATGDYATIVKLLRVSLLVFVVAMVSIAYRGSSEDATTRAPVIPWFLGVFIVLAAANSAGFMVQNVAVVIESASRGLLVIAIAALGTKTSLGKLMAAGWRPMFLIVTETLWIAGFVLLSISLVTS